MNRESSMGRGTTRLATLLATVVACSFLTGAGTAMAQSEEGVKAAFLYNFAKHIEWPEKAFADAQAPITVGFIGADSLADAFERNTTGKNAHDRDFVVKKITAAADVERCHIVFVGDAKQVPAVLAALKGKPALTVGEGDLFATSGGMIRFIRDGAKVGFDLDLGAAKAAELKLDPKLKQIARTTKG